MITVRLCKRLRTQSTATLLHTQDAAKRLHEFLLPLYSGPPTESDSVLQSINELCKKAANFTLSFRECDSDIVCESFEQGAPFKSMDMECMNPEVWESHVNDEDKLVSFTVFGALVKPPGNNLHENFVIQKAFIIAQ